MEYIPSWFGINEYYALLITVWLFLFSWIVVNLIKIKANLSIKDRLLKIKNWWNERKKRKEMKSLN